MSLTSRGPIGGPGKPKSNFKSNCDDLEIFYDLKKGINGMGFEKKITIVYCQFKTKRDLIKNANGKIL